ncbi:MAG TPA: hypothetical protein VG425_17980 [Casimicrobiaceae bacterium]|jgi:hypothetical protein|nr:hypothetical protein [Casimicrobiaceae bacterium]
MTSRLFLISVFAVLAFAVVPALAQMGGGMPAPPSNKQVPIPQPPAATTAEPPPPTPSTQTPSAHVPLPTIPPANCKQPEYPGARALNSAILAFNKDYKAYGECVRKYIEENKAWIDAIVETNNRTVEEYNKYNTELKKMVDEANQ